MLILVIVVLLVLLVLPAVTEHAEGQYKHEPLPKSNFMEFMECELVRDFCCGIRFLTYISYVVFCCALAPLIARRL